MHSPIHIASYITKHPLLNTPNRPLFIHENQTYSAADVLHHVTSLTHYFTTTLGLHPGDRVCILSHTNPTFIELALAVTAAGCIATPLNWRWSPSECIYAIQLVDAHVLITDTACKSLAENIHHSLMCCGDNNNKTGDIDILLIDDDSSIQSIICNSNSSSCIQRPQQHKINTFSSSSPPPPQQLRTLSNGDDVAFIIFTSGTTGAPRAAALTHSNMHFQCKNKLKYCNYSSHDVYLHTSPLFHVGGLCSALAMMLSGAQHVFMPIFSAPTMINMIQEYKISAFIAVPTMLIDLFTVLEDTKHKHKQLNSVKTVLVGAGATSNQLQSQFTRTFPQATMYSAYGMTEACSSITFCTLISPIISTTTTSKDKHIENSSSQVFVGRPADHIQLGIIPQSDLSSSSYSIHHHGQGEIVTRGPHLMIKYWNDPTATSSSFLPGGWLKTGDLGILHRDGSLYLQGRAKDTIKTGGENVAAAEVERVVSQHPAVHAVAVIGIPDERLTERVTAVIVLKKGWTWSGGTSQFQMIETYNNNNNCEDDRGESVVDGGDIQLFCRKKGLSGFKLPRAVAVVDALPMNSTGKVMKNEVKSRITKLHTKIRSRL